MVLELNETFKFWTNVVNLHLSKSSGENLAVGNILLGKLIENFLSHLLNLLEVFEERVIDVLNPFQLVF